MSALSLRRRFDRNRGTAAVWLIVGLGLLVALHHGEPMAMGHGHEAGMSSEAGVAMICLGVLAVGLALAARVGTITDRRHLSHVRAPLIFTRRFQAAPAPRSRAGPELSQVFRL